MDRDRQCVIPRNSHLQYQNNPVIGYFPCNTTVTLGDKQKYPNAPDNIGCLGLYKNANSDFCSVQYQDPNDGSFGPYTKKTGCNPVLANVVECPQ